MARDLLNSEELHAKLGEIAVGIKALAGTPQDAVLLGIRTRGAVMAERLHRILRDDHGWDVPLGILDITLYRDDLSQLAINPLVRRTEFPFDVEGKTVLLIDDVLYTGRTIRSAIDEIIDFGRPKAIRLCVLVDRGGREFPIQADCCPLTVEVAEDEVVKVMLQECDGAEKVIVALRSDMAAK